MLCAHLSVGLHRRCLKLSFVVLCPRVGRQVEKCVQLRLFAKAVRTAGRTALQNSVQTKAGVRDRAGLYDERCVLDAEVKGATVQDKVAEGAFVVTYSKDLPTVLRHV